MSQRRFPPPWTVEKIPGGFKVVDANKQALAYLYSRETPGDANIAGVLTEDEAWRIARNIAKLPTLLKRGGSFGTRFSRRRRLARQAASGQAPKSAYCNQALAESAKQAKDQIAKKRKLLRRHVVRPHLVGRHHGSAPTFRHLAHSGSAIQLSVP